MLRRLQEVDFENLDEGSALLDRGLRAGPARSRQYPEYDRRLYILHHGDSGRVDAGAIRKSPSSAIYSPLPERQSDVVV